MKTFEADLAQSIGREIQPILNEDCKRAIRECDKDNDGMLTKEEMNSWLVKFMK